MNIVSYSKCKKCHKKLHVSELEESSEGVGMVCSNKELCKKEQLKNKPEKES